MSINIGGFQTYPASYVCINRYGDCKALTNYMQSMLKYIGIKSYYTLIYAGDRIIDTDLDFPSQVFNHVILTVPLANDTIYLECTSKNIPLGYMRTFTQGRKALLVDQDKSRFIDIPSLKPDDVLCSRSFLIDMNTSEVKLTATERGDNYERSLYLVSDVSKNTVDKYIRNNILSGSFDLHDFKFRKENLDSAKIEMDLECKMHNLYKEYGNNIVISPFSIDIPSYESPDKRKTDVQLDYPEYYQDEIIYQFSNDKKIKKPENISVESKYGEYSITYQVDENKLVVKKMILIYQGRYNQEEYKDFYDFITSVKNNEIKKLYLETI